MLYQQHESHRCELKLWKEDFIKMVANDTYITYIVKWLCVCVCDVWEQRVRNMLLVCETMLTCFLLYKEKVCFMRSPCCISSTFLPI